MLSHISVLRFESMLSQTATGLATLPADVINYKQNVPAPDLFICSTLFTFTVDRIRTKQPLSLPGLNATWANFNTAILANWWNPPVIDEAYIHMRTCVCRNIVHTGTTTTTKARVDLIAVQIFGCMSKKRRWRGNYLHIALSLHVLNYLPSNCVHSQLSMRPMHNNMLLPHTHTHTDWQAGVCLCATSSWTLFGWAMPWLLQYYYMFSAAFTCS